MSLKDNFLAALYNPRLAFSTGQKYLSRKQILSRVVKQNKLDALVRSGSDSLGADAWVAKLAQRIGVLRLADDGWRQWIGVSEENFAPVLSAILSASPRTTLHSTYKAEDYDYRQALVRGSVRIRLNGLAGEPLIDLDCYQRKSKRHWVSANHKNNVARSVFDDCWRSAGLTEVQNLLAGPYWGQCRDAMPIDVVCTWVNYNDPNWRREYSRCAQGHNPATDAMSRTRFQSNDELRYLLRSIAWNLPWHGRVFVVSNCAPPNWLDVKHPGVEWVPHETVLSSEFLPTFSSHAIETALHKIPNLSEHFIYANDDMFFCRPRGKNFFYRPNGASSAFLETAAMVTSDAVKGAPDYLNASRNSAALIHSRYGVRPTRLHKHVPYALNKSLLREIEETFPEAIEQTRRSRFRAEGDVNVTSFLYHHYALLEGAAQEAKVKGLFVRSSDLRWRNQLNQMEHRQIDVLCLNEGGRVAPGRDWRKIMQYRLQSLFPHASPWEKA